MPFKGLEDRFAAKAKELYAHGGLDQIKPTDPNAEETANDTQFLPVGSVKRDLRALTHFFTTRDGLLFLGKQELQQSANAFSETRLINPLFVIANVAPGVHARRPLTGTANFAAKGDTAHKSRAAYDPKIGGAGRLQHETSDAAIANVVGNGANGSLLSQFRPFQLVQTLRGIFNLSNAGSLDIDDRPELHINGNYFSIALWQGFQQQYGSRGALENAEASLRVGDFRGALDNLKNAGSALLRETGITSVLSAVHIDGRGTPNLHTEGQRYFITDSTQADRYLPGSVDSSGDRPSLNLAYLNRRPYILPPPPVSTDTTASPTSAQLADTLTKATRLANNFASATSIFGDMGTIGLQALNVASANPLSLDDQSSAKDHMMFQDLSLESRYNTDQHIVDLRDHLKTQIANGLTLNPGKQYFTTKNKFAQIGVENNIDPKVRNPVGGYLSDPMNINFKGVPKDGDDLINVYITDEVNDRIIPFRAFVTNIHEAVNPEISDRRYIGRVERNIVYIGVNRELSFVLRINAFSEAELQGVWQKINFLTSLCYPSKFSNGFMVPPFVKLTIGNMYKDQPGIFRSVSYEVEDGISWETKAGKQVPHGVTVQLAYSILDKKQYTGENSVTDGFFSLTTPQS